MRRLMRRRAAKKSGQPRWGNRKLEKAVHLQPAADNALLGKSAVHSWIDRLAWKLSPVHAKTAARPALKKGPCVLERTHSQASFFLIRRARKRRTTNSIPLFGTSGCFFSSYRSICSRFPIMAPVILARLKLAGAGVDGDALAIRPGAGPHVEVVAHGAEAVEGAGRKARLEP